MTIEPGSRAPRGPAWWEWVLPPVGGIGVELIVNKVSNASWAWWLGGAAAAVSAVAPLVRWLRSRRVRAAGGEPAPTVRVGPDRTPTTLPYTSGFIGRVDDLIWIVEALESEHAVAVVGRRAVGTSSCVVQAANDIRDRYTVYYLDLRPDNRPMPARAVSAALARAVGLAESAPFAHARDRLDDERVLLVLDNVDDPAQLGPLLPPVTRCRLLLAGTPALARADGVAARWLAEPDLPDAVEMFAAAGDTAVGANPRRSDPRLDPAVREIVELCGRQPRTIRALGYRMARHGWRSADLLGTLRYAAVAPVHQRVPLAYVVILITDLDVAYAALDPAARRLFRLLSLAPVALDRPAIAACTGLSPGRVERLLDQLADAAFVRGAEGDRYEIRPLLAGYARLHLRREESTWRRVGAQVRLLRHLARRAERHGANLAAAGLASPALPLADDPYGWFELHADLLRAVVVGTPGGPGPAPLPRRVRRWWFRLAVALCGWYAHGNRLDDWDAVCRAVLAAPTAGDRPEIAAWAHNEQGVLRRRRGDPQGAAVALTLALAERGRRGTAQARMNLGLALLDLGQVEDAIEHLELARRHRGHADRTGQALSDLALGAAYLARGDPEPARHLLVRAANTFRGVGEPRGYAAALTNLVLAQWLLGEHLDAAQSWSAALREYRTLTDQTGLAAALLNAGAAMVTSAPSRAGQAHQLLSEGRRLREQWRPGPGLGRTLLYLGDALELLGRPAEARAHWTDAAGVCEEVGDRPGAAEANRRLSVS